MNENHSVEGVLDERAAAGEITIREVAGSANRSQLLEAVLGQDVEWVDAPKEPFFMDVVDLVTHCLAGAGR